MHATTVIIDGCGFGVDDIELPKFGPDGLPTGEVVQVKQLTFVVSEGTPSQLLVHVRFTDENYKDFIERLTERKITVATAADLAKLNGG